ncbi:MAG: putative NBD/HSP70 family sugar kinase [Glaciecola sp.]
MHIGIDVGGSKIEIIVIDNSGNELFRQRIVAPSGSYKNTLMAINDLIVEAEVQLGRAQTIGIGMPGSICAHSQKVQNSNSTWINGQRFKPDIEQLLCRNIDIENDANCFVLSEARDGAAIGSNSVFGVILGTGCGGGLWVNGGLVIGANSLGGEWGHNPLPFPTFFGSHSHEAEQSILLDHFDGVDKNGVKPASIYAHKEAIFHQVDSIDACEYPGPLCYCGKRGCIESWISGSGFMNDYERLYKQQLSAPEIISLAQSGKTEALAAVNRYYERVAKSLAQVINIIDPEVIVLGGGMSNIDELYSEVPKRWHKYIFSTQSVTRLVKAKHGDSSGVRGAASLFRRMSK